MTTISGAGAHGSVAGTDRVPASKAGTKGYHSVDAIASYAASGKLDFVATLSQLEALSTAQAAAKGYICVLYRSLPGDGYVGLFVWRSGDQSANITADPAKAFWVAPSAASTGASGAWQRQYSGLPDVRWFDIALDTPDANQLANLQRCIDYQIEVDFPFGVIGFDDPGPQWKPKSALRGRFGERFYVFSENKPGWNEASWLRYIGAGGSNTVAVNLSRAAVGTAPTAQNDESTNLFVGALTGVIIDAGAADIGVYAARCGYLFDLDIAVVGSKKRGFWAGKCWGFKNWSVRTFLTDNAGFSIGENYFSWDAAEINAGHFSILHSLKTGGDGTHDDTTAPKDGAGGIWMPERSTQCDVMICEVTDGPSLYYSPGTGNRIRELHCEFAGLYDPAEADDKDQSRTANSALAEGRMTGGDWFIWGVGSSTSRQNFIDAIWFAASGTDNVPAIRLTGTAPAEPWVFDNVHGVDKIYADWGNYEITHAESTLVDSSASLPDITSHLPQYGRPENLISARATLYCGNLASNSGVAGRGDGVDASNRMALASAIEVARINRGVAVLDLSAVTSGSAGMGPELDGRGITREIIIDGATAGRLTNDATNNRGLKLKNFAAKVTIKNFVSIDRLYFENCANVLIDDCPIIRMAASGSTSDPALNLDASTVHLAGTSVVTVAASGAATKICARLKNASKLIVSNAASGTFAGYTTGHAIEFDEGGGEVHISTTTETCAWARQTNITKLTGGECGIVYAPNGTNPYGGNKVQALTLASDAATLVKGGTSATIDTQSAAATDDLSTLNYTGGDIGDRAVIRAANAARIPVVKHNVGNIKLAYGDFALVGTEASLTLEWDGTNWIEVSRRYSAALNYSARGGTSITGTTTETTSASITIPGKLMRANGRIRISGTYRNNNSANNKTLRLRVGGTGTNGTVIWSLVPTTTLSTPFEVWWLNTGAANTNQTERPTSGATGNQANDIVTTTVDTASDFTLYFNVLLANGGDNANLESVMVEVFPKE